MSKTIQVKYVFEVTRDVRVPDKIPEPYTQEEWEDQRISDVGQQLEFGLDGSVYWYSQRLD